MSAKLNEIKRPKFIPHQRIYSLDLTPEERFRAREYLQLEKLPDHGRRESEAPEMRQVDKAAEMYRNRWREELPRLELLADPAHKRVCITVSAGVGKSKAMEQLVALRQSVDPNHLVILVHFSELPSDPEEFIPSLVERFTSYLDDLPVDHISHQLPALESTDLYIRSLLRTGQLTLAVDGLDEVNVKVGKKKAKALRRFLSRFPNCCCCVAGRPYAIAEYYWLELLATYERDDDASSLWEFWLIGSFTNQQIQDYLGSERYKELRILQADIDFTPRVLESYRTLHSEVLSRVRSVADVFWFSIDKALKLDRDKIGRANRLGLDHDEILDFLSACAITLVTWKHDPMSEGDRAAGRADHGQEPVRRLEKLTRFRKLVFERMKRIYGTDWPISRKWKLLLKLNSSHVEFGFFSHPEPESLIWRDATDRDFFAALWMVRSSNLEEQNWLSKRQSSVVLANFSEDADRFTFADRLTPGRDSFYTKETTLQELNELWCFVCGMPSEPFIEREDDFEKTDRWLNIIAPLFCNVHQKRPTELMYRCWPNLLLRAGFLNTRSWSEYDLLQATKNAQHRCDPRSVIHQQNVANVRFSQKSEDNAFRVIESFLHQYPTIRDSETDLARICREDLEEHWCNCESHADMVVCVGHEKSRDNCERDKILANGYSLCAYQVTNRLYRLFEICHASSKYWDCRNDCERGAATHITWYDSMMFSIWCHGYLPSEWEWEHASRARCQSPNGRNSIWHWGDDESQLKAHAWVTEGFVTTVGRLLPNRYGLYDTLGNVREWCRNSYGGEVDAFVQHPQHIELFVQRVLRGGGFNTSDFATTCSYRISDNPAIADYDVGCRVYRINDR